MEVLLFLGLVAAICIVIWLLIVVVGLLDLALTWICEEVLVPVLELIWNLFLLLMFVVFFPITVPIWLWENRKEKKKQEEEALWARIALMARSSSPQRKPPPPKPKPQTGYTSDWGGVSARHKKARGWRCEHCEVYCGGPGDQPLLHVHHWDRNPQNNRSSNLVALCIQCHSRQPGAGHKRIGSASRRDGRWDRIARLRRN